MKRRTFLQRLGLGMAAAMVNANALLGHPREAMAVQSVEAAGNRIAEEIINGEMWLARTVAACPPLTLESFKEAVEMIKAAPAYQAPTHVFHAGDMLTLEELAHRHRPSLFRRIFRRWW